MTTLTRDQEDVLLRAATAAPSLHNTQPWKFVVQDDTLDLYGDPQRRLQHVDPQARQLHISCGAALFNLRVAARRLGLEPRVSLLPDSNPLHLARVVLSRGSKPTLDEAEMYAAIPRRRTNRRPFAERTLPPDVVSALEDAAVVEGARLHVISKDEERRRLTELVHDADLNDSSDHAIRTERAAWVGGEPGRDDGVPISAVGPVPADVTNVFRDLAAARVVRGRQLAQFERRPALATLLTDRDDPRDWLRAGMALERILLVATVHDVAVSFVNQPLERPDLRWLVRDPMAGIGNPQMLLRMGYGEPVAATPRRPLEDVVTRVRDVRGSGEPVPASEILAPEGPPAPSSGTKVPNRPDLPRPRKTQESGTTDE